MQVPPEALPVCVEYVPAFWGAVEMLPELLAKDAAADGAYSLYYVDVAAWVALKYPTARFDPLIPVIVERLSSVGTSSSFDSCMTALTIGTRLCLALPQLVLSGLLPLITELLDRAKALAAGSDRLSDLLQERQEEAVRLLDLWPEHASKLVYNKMPKCI
jgi:hypothetical protein